MANIGDDMLTQEKLKELMSYDPDTGIFTRLKSIQPRFIGKSAGCENAKGYIEISIGKIKYKAHRLAWLYMTGMNPYDQIDHINGVKSDNRWSNLRQANNSQNCSNKKARGYSLTRSGMYQSEIQHKGTQYYLGCFRTEEEARQAYIEAGKKLHGEFFCGDML